MSRKAFSVSRRAAWTACLIVSLAGTFVLAAEETVTLNGEIEIAEYDDDGFAVSVTVYDSEWGSVLIQNEGKGTELLNHVGAVAKVTGSLVELDEETGYTYAIRVSSYSIETPAEPEDDESWDPGD